MWTTQASRRVVETRRSGAVTQVSVIRSMLAPGDSVMSHSLLRRCKSLHFQRLYWTENVPRTTGPVFRNPSSQIGPMQGRQRPRPESLSGPRIGIDCVQANGLHSRPGCPMNRPQVVALLALALLAPPALLLGQEAKPQPPRYETRAGPRPRRHRQVLHGPRDRPGHGPPGGRLARPAGAREGRTAAKLLEAAQAQARRGRRRHRRRQRLFHLPPGRARRPQGQGATPWTSSRRCSTSSASA